MLDNDNGRDNSMTSGLTAGAAARRACPTGTMAAQSNQNTNNETENRRQTSNRLAIILQCAERSSALARSSYPLSSPRLLKLYKAR